VAIVTVLFFLVVVGAVAVATLWMARRSSGVGILGLDDAQLVAAGEGTLFAALENWEPDARAAQAVGSTVALTEGLSAPGAPFTSAYVARLTTHLYALVADATLPGGRAARRYELLVRLPLPVPPIRSAVVSAGNVALGAGVRIVRDDSALCDDTASTAITVAPGARVIADGVTPPIAVREDAAAADSLTYFRIGDDSWADLAARADIQLAPGVQLAPAPVIDDSRCIAIVTNWGDPRRGDPPSPCAARLPLIHASSDLTLVGGRGQGVLLVDGRLRLGGPLEFSGQIVARRGIETIADGVELRGMVLSASASNDDGAAVSLRNAMTLHASVCDAQHGVASWLTPRPVRERSWAELF
jgi:hypothetical protein